MSDQDDIKLRDQFAMVALQALINKSGYEAISYIDDSYKCRKQITIAAYKIADEMRKTRLIVFE